MCLLAMALCDSMMHSMRLHKTHPAAPDSAHPDHRPPADHTPSVNLHSRHTPAPTGLPRAGPRRAGRASRGAVVARVGHEAAEGHGGCRRARGGRAAVCVFACAVVGRHGQEEGGTAGCIAAGGKRPTCAIEERDHEVPHTRCLACMFKLVRLAIPHPPTPSLHGHTLTLSTPTGG